MNDIHLLSAHELVSLIKSGKISAPELMQACYDRIHATNQQLNAVVALLPIEEALAKANVVQQDIQQGKVVGTLAGLPILVKDMEDASGFVTSFGSVVYKDKWVDHDSIQVARLKRAGAIIIGKSNTSEFGLIPLTKNLLFGVTRNPWDQTRTPGGSSGGAAAAIASGMVPLATASDGGGSIRIPAAFTGCYGLKPTYGRIPWGPEPMMRWSHVAVVGPITRTVQDAALFLDAVVGVDSRDPFSLPHPGYRYIDIIEQPAPSCRIAWSPTMGFGQVQPDVMRVLEKAVAVFSTLGHKVERVDQVLNNAAIEFLPLMSGELSVKLSNDYEQHSNDFTHIVQQVIELGKKQNAMTLGDIQQGRAQLVNTLWQFFERYDVLLTPTTATEAIDAKGHFPRILGGVEYTDISQTTPFTAYFNYTGHPAASVPAGHTDSGLPCGLQIVVPHQREDLLLQLSAAFEAAQPWNDHWPTL